MKRRILSMLAVLMLNSVVGPASSFEELGEVSLEPMQKPSDVPFVPGTEVHWLKDGKNPVSYYYETVAAELVTVRRNDGCNWTSTTYMSFSPAFRWENCEAASGTQEIIETKGNPWPLSERTRFQYTFTGKYKDDLGQPWRSIWKCAVDKQVRVKVPAGVYDTYKLVCEDDWNKRAYWISPELGHHVAFEDNNKIYMSRWHTLELVKVVSL